ncbi:uncharacterized protein LOC141608811 [Silene latifolia]|uniref:uncharacterized protein LOC141608811 n=1 Tax=Silene latifolia TaxID=37657 RepID=UPI003D78AB38
MALPNSEALVNMEDEYAGEDVGDADTHKQVELEWVAEGEEEYVESRLCVVGRLWTDRQINLKALIDTMISTWKTKGAVGEVVDKQKKIVTFKFDDEEDKQRVLAEQPWHFERHVLVLAAVNGDVIPTEVPLFFSPIWARIYDLPIMGRQNLENACNIGNIIGTFVTVDNSVNPTINRSMRIRVVVDIRKPLVDSLHLKLKGGKKWRIRVSYESLPLFCYICGRMGHGEKDCEQKRGLIGEG